MENKEEEHLSTESIIMFVMCFVTVGILLICLFSIICCTSAREIGFGFVPGAVVGVLSLRPRPSTMASTSRWSASNCKLSSPNVITLFRNLADFFKFFALPIKSDLQAYRFSNSLQSHCKSLWEPVNIKPSP